MAMKGLILKLIGIVSALFAIFFLYYTVRLILVNVFSADAATHRTSGMLIGAVAFPVASIAFGTISWLCLRHRRQSNSNDL